jgi:hypothetical protein
MVILVGSKFLHVLNVCIHPLQRAKELVESNDVVRVVSRHNGDSDVRHVLSPNFRDLE